MADVKTYTDQELVFLVEKFSGALPELARLAIDELKRRNKEYLLFKKTK